MRGEASTRAAGAVALALACLLSIGAAGCGNDPTLPAGAGPRPARAGSSTPSTPSANAALPRVAFHRVASFDDMVTAIASHPARPEVLVGLRSGRLRRIGLLTTRRAVEPRVASSVVLDLSASTDTDGEGGLLGMAFDPTGSWLYVSRLTTDRTVTVTVFPYRPGATLREAAGRTVLAVPHPAPYHNGGDLAVDRSGDLFLGVGDGSEDPTAQDLASPLGSVLRIPADRLRAVTDGGDALADPSEFIVVKGVRNPWRLAVDDAAGVLWVADVGNLEVEEIDRLPLDRLVAGRPLNLGWPYFEGSRRRNVPTAGEEFVQPVKEYEHSSTACAVIGGSVAARSGVPSLDGALLYGDFCSEEIRALRVDATSGRVRRDRVIGRLPAPVVAFGTGPSGEIYAADARGDVHRLDPTSWTTPGIAPIDRGGTTTTTEGPISTTEPPRAQLDPAACGIVEQFVRLGSLPAGTEAEARALLTSVTDTVREKVTHLPADLAPDGALAVSGLGDARRQLDAAGWTPAARTQVVDDVFAHRPPYGDVYRAVQHIEDALSGSCS